MKRYTADELRRLVAGHCREYGSQAKLSRQAGISRQRLNNFLAGRDSPPRRLLSYYGLEKRVNTEYVDTEPET